MRYVLRELRHGLRRHLSMHVAVVLTLFVTLTLVGAGLFLQQQAQRTQAHWGSQFELTVYLCRDNDSNVDCAGEVTPAQRQAVLQVVADTPGVASWRVESKQEAYEKVQQLYGEDRFQGATAAVTEQAMPESVWITVEDPDQLDRVERAVAGLAGVSETRDLGDLLGPVYQAIVKTTYAMWGVAGFLVLAAVLMVANTLRLAALARRKEIEIMRLVGASSTYVALPFLLEALVTALAGVTLAAGALGALWWFGIQGFAVPTFRFTPWLDVEAMWRTLAVVGTLGAALTIVPTLVLTRKYLRV